MTATLQTTYTHLVGSSFEESYDPDLRQELDLSNEARAEMLAAAKASFTSQADVILAPYGCQMNGNGEIIRTNIDDEDVVAWDDEAVREELAQIDVSEVLA